MARPFLTARWLNLILITYRVPPALLEKRLPSGLTLDTRDGQAFVSLVGFEFQNTRVLGISWPGYRNFAELNLRFYVRQGAERGVVFVREFVPRRLIAGLARLIYNEPYQAAPLSGCQRAGAGTLTVSYTLIYADGTHTIAVSAKKPAYRPSEDSTEHFFKEHHWGYGTSRSGKLIRYQVEHPVWDVYPVENSRVDLDWRAVYGPEWAGLQGASPDSVILTAGSAVKVFPRGKAG